MTAGGVQRKLSENFGLNVCSLTKKQIHFREEQLRTWKHGLECIPKICYVKKTSDVGFKLTISITSGKSIGSWDSLYKYTDSYIASENGVNVGLGIQLQSLNLRLKLFPKM